MKPLSRRAFVATGSAIAPAAFAGSFLLPTGSGAAALRDSTEGAIIHTFAFRWKPAVTEDQKTHAMKEIKALQGQIPGLLETYVGVNFSPRSQGYALGGVMRFANRAALEAYPEHPVHQKLVAWLMPLIEPVEVDFQSI